MKRCPFCAEEIQDAAILCRFCQRDLRFPLPAPLSITPVPAWEHKARELAAAGRRVEAIRLVRINTFQALREAKNVVDSWDPVATQRRERDANKGCVAFFILMVLMDLVLLSARDETATSAEEG